MFFFSLVLVMCIQTVYWKRKKEYLTLICHQTFPNLLIFLILQEFLTRDYLLMDRRNMIVLIQPLDNSKNLKQI